MTAEGEGETEVREEGEEGEVKEGGEAGEGERI